MQGLDEIDGGLLGFGVVAEGRDPMDTGFATEPGELAFGVVAMALLGFRDGDFFTDALEENGLRLTIAERVQHLDGPVTGEESACFIDEAGGEHGGAARLRRS